MHAGQVAERVGVGAGRGLDALVGGNARCDILVEACDQVPFQLSSEKRSPAIAFEESLHIVGRYGRWIAPIDRHPERGLKSGADSVRAAEGGSE